MELIKWNESYALGLEEIDEQHKKWVKIINKLYVAFVERNHNEILEEILEEVIDYTRYHFTTEEKYFREFDYGNGAMHIMEHVTFIKRIEEFQKRHKEGNVQITTELMHSLQRWLLNHIMVSDFEYVDNFKKHGLR